MQLIKITEQNGDKAVSAKELYDYLGYDKSQWSRWYQKNIIDNEFALQDIDYQVFDLMSSSELGGRPTKDFALSIDFSKKLSMLARTKEGENARDYFVDCEKVAKNPLQNISRIDLARMIIESEEENQRLQIELKATAPKVLFTDAVIGSASSCLIGELAKLISQNGCTIGQNNLFVWLRENGFLGTSGERRNIPNQKYVEQGLFELKKGVRTGNDGVMHTTITTKVTGKGQVYFVNKFLKQNA